MSTIAPDRLACPCCGRDIGCGRAGVRLMPHRVSRDPSRNAPCAGSRLPVDLLARVAELEAVARVAVVVPADPTLPVHTVAWFDDGQVIDTINSGVGSDDTDAVYSQFSGALITCWFDANGAVRPDSGRQRNARYEAFENLIEGTTESTLFGDVVITGDADDIGDTLGLDSELISELLAEIGGAA